jgi:hypothetical protein
MLQETLNQFKLWMDHFIENQHFRFELSLKLLICNSKNQFLNILESLDQQMKEFFESFKKYFIYTESSEFMFNVINEITNEILNSKNI